MTIDVLIPSCRVQTEVSWLTVLHSQILQGKIFQVGEVLWCLFSSQLVALIFFLEKIIYHSISSCACNSKVNLVSLHCTQLIKISQSLDWLSTRDSEPPLILHDKYFVYYHGNILQKRETIIVWKLFLWTVLHCLEFLPASNNCQSVSHAESVIVN